MDEERSDGGGGWFSVSVSVSVFLCVLLSRVASDYSNNSAVCFGILRPLRSLREIKDRSFVFHAECAKSAENYCLSYFTLALERSQTSLRQECAESSIHPLPPFGVLAPVSGGESVTTENLR